MRRLVLACFIAAGASAQYPTPSRPVAPIVSPSWHVSEAARDAEGEVDTVMARLHIGRESTVADIGAGRGYYTVRLAKRVAHVYAEDVTPSYVTALRARVDSAHLTDVTVTLGDTADPHLPARSIDVALLVHMYHEVSQPYGLMAHICAALKPGGRVAIVDLDRDILSHGTPRALLERELTAMGYHEQSFSRLGQAYLAVFTSGCGTTSR
jgi:ubiquinone/menaquinone biosynthesis C-methylase UbiE